MLWVLGCKDGFWVVSALCPSNGGRNVVIHVSLSPILTAWPPSPLCLLTPHRYAVNPAMSEGFTRPIVTHSTGSYFVFDPDKWPGMEDDEIGIRVSSEDQEAIVVSFPRDAMTRYVAAAMRKYDRFQTLRPRFVRDAALVCGCAGSASPARFICAMVRTDVYRALKRLPIWEDEYQQQQGTTSMRKRKLALTREHFHLLATCCSITHIPKGQAVFSQGDTGSSMYIVVAGKFAVEAQVGRCAAHARMGVLDDMDDAMHLAASRREEKEVVAMQQQRGGGGGARDDGGWTRGRGGGRSGSVSVRKGKEDGRRMILVRLRRRDGVSLTCIKV